MMGSTRGSRGGGAPIRRATDPVEVMIAAGAVFREPPITDGEIHRTATAAHPRKKNFSYLLYPDGQGGWFENHETGDGMCRIYLAGDRGGTTTEQKTQRESARIERARRAEERRIEARDLARGICDRSRPADSGHPYLRKKQIKPYELLQDGTDLIAPIVSVEGKIQSIERISSNGTKKFLYGGSVSGNYYAVGVVGVWHRLLICEGVATSHCLFEATRLPTVAALSAGNLEAVGRVIRRVFPYCKTTVCADDDWKTKGNPGLAAAKKTAQIVDGRVAVPNFSKCKRGEKDTDFNDLQLLLGLSEVRRQIIWSL